MPLFANLLCQSPTYLLMEAFIKVTNDLVTFHREDNVLLRVSQHGYMPRISQLNNGQLPWYITFLPREVDSISVNYFYEVFIIVAVLVVFKLQKKILHPFRILDNLCIIIIMMFCFVIDLQMQRTHNLH